MAAHLRSDMRASAPPPLWGWGDRECDGEGAGQSENMQGDSRPICSDDSLIFSQMKFDISADKFDIFSNQTCSWRWLDHFSQLWLDPRCWILNVLPSLPSSSLTSSTGASLATGNNAMWKRGEPNKYLREVNYLREAKYLIEDYFCCRISPECTDSSLLEAWRSECRSRSSCSFKVTEGFIQIDPSCQGKKEMRTEHLCGEI